MLWYPVSLETLVVLVWFQKPGHELLEFHEPENSFLPGKSFSPQRGTREKRDTDLHGFSLMIDARRARPAFAPSAWAVSDRDLCPGPAGKRARMLGRALRGKKARFPAGPGQRCLSAKRWPMQREQKLADPVRHRLSVRIRVNLCPLFLCVLSDSAVKYPFLPGKDSQDSSTDLASHFHCMGRRPALRRLRPGPDQISDRQISV